MSARSTILAAMLVLAGCQTLAAGAKEHFSKDYSCPPDRIEARDRPDLHPSSFRTQPPTPTPPAAVAADPARLAIWEKNHRVDITQYDDDYDIEEAHGCGHDAFYQCHHGQQHANVAFCSQQSAVPPNVSHW